jgi:alpha-mannosidase
VRRPRVHLICNAHLDPVWQWRWEEGAAEAVATFGTAARLLREHPAFIFNHNEALLYRWVEKYDPALFREIQRLVKAGRWAVSGGWYLQPDVNMPGLESLVRQVAEGRRYFWEKFRARPVVAYNFDSFGHGAGLPQVLRLSGYKMYIHMRPQPQELRLPADLYRWRGVDGSEILALRIEVGLYHTERYNIEEKLRAGTELALRLGRDVPVFWGLGNHGGGATREDLARIDDFMAKEKRVAVLHSTPDRLYADLKRWASRAPVVDGDLQRVFTGCYTSLARVKRKTEENLGTLVQTEALRAATWWLSGQNYPEQELQEAWRDHIQNDFHDILTGSCSEPAEKDALDLYGKVLDTARRLRLEGLAVLNRRGSITEPPAIPISVCNTNPALTRVPVEVECMADYRPFWTGEWHLRLFTPEGREIPAQEEQPESLLSFNWRKKLCFMARLPGIGVSHFFAGAFPGKPKRRARSAAKVELNYKIDKNTGLITRLEADEGRSCLGGPLFEPLVVEDRGDSWGADIWSYRDVAGRFSPVKGSLQTIEDGPIRTITEAALEFNRSRIVLQTIFYPTWPVIEFRLRVHWNEERRLLKLAVPTALRRSSLFCEIPGGAIARPDDGGEHVFGRWALIEGETPRGKAAVAVIGAGPHGLDFSRGELRLSVLRSAAYCHEQNFPLSDSPARKYMDQGVHDVRLLVTAGSPEKVRSVVAALADWMSAPPFALAHLPVGSHDRVTYVQPGGLGRKGARDDIRDGSGVDLLSLTPTNIRLAACKRSGDGRALVLRLQETSGRATAARLNLLRPFSLLRLRFRPFEVKTVRVEKSGRWGEVDLISETLKRAENVRRKG